MSKNSPVTVEKTEEGIKVSHGGYYVDGKDWGGVAFNEKHLLDGLSVTIKFDKVPEVTSADDCWISIDFLTKPQLFQVGDVKGNPGFIEPYPLRKTRMGALRGRFVLEGRRHYKGKQ